MTNIVRHPSTPTASLGPLILDPALIELFLQALVHVLDRDLQRLVLDPKDLLGLGTGMNVGLGRDLGSLTGSTNGDVGNLVARERVDDIDWLEGEQSTRQREGTEPGSHEYHSSPISCPVRGPTETMNRLPPASGTVKALT
jgi:hypothetical protein